MSVEGRCVKIIIGKTVPKVLNSEALLQELHKARAGPQNADECAEKSSSGGGNLTAYLAAYPYSI